MNLEEGQRKQVAAWVAEGLKLSDIQKKLSSDLGINLTYMELRLLVDDLKVMPKDPEPPKPVDLGAAVAAAKAAPTAPGRGGKPEALASQTPPPGPSQGVSVSVDQLARPGALASGKVTFSDGNSAEWYLDQFGRLALVPQQTGYKPSQADVQSFQTALDSELRKMGF